MELGNAIFDKDPAKNTFETVSVVWFEETADLHFTNNQTAFHANIVNERPSGGTDF